MEQNKFKVGDIVCWRGDITNTGKIIEVDDMEIVVIWDNNGSFYRYSLEYLNEVTKIIPHINENKLRKALKLEK